MQYLVLYSSKTGNTERVAETIFQALPGKSKLIEKIEEFDGTENAETVLVGFWVNRGSCSMDVADLLGKLEGKRIALFGTCGMGHDPAYYQTIERKAATWLPDECDYRGCFLCQGKMPKSVREKYEAMRGQIPEEQLAFQLKNFDEALSHPNETDLQNARDFVQKVIADR